MPQEALCFLRRFFFLLKMEAGGGIGGTVFDSGIDTVTAGDGVIASFPEFDVVLPEVQAVLAGWFLHEYHLSFICHKLLYMTNWRKVKIVSVLFRFFPKIVDI